MIDRIIIAIEAKRDMTRAEMLEWLESDEANMPLTRWDAEQMIDDEIFTEGFISGLNHALKIIELYRGSR